MLIKVLPFLAIFALCNTQLYSCENIPSKNTLQNQPSVQNINMQQVENAINNNKNNKNNKLSNIEVNNKIQEINDILQGNNIKLLKVIRIKDKKIAKHHNIGNKKNQSKKYKLSKDSLSTMLQNKTKAINKIKVNKNINYEKQLYYNKNICRNLLNEYDNNNIYNYKFVTPFNQHNKAKNPFIIDISSEKVKDNNKTYDINNNDQSIKKNLLDLFNECKENKSVINNNDDSTNYKNYKQDMNKTITEQNNNDIKQNLYSSIFNKQLND